MAIRFSAQVVIALGLCSIWAGPTQDSNSPFAYESLNWSGMPVGVTEVAFSPDGSGMAVGNGKGEVAFRPLDPSALFRLIISQHRKVSALTFSGDGAYVAAGTEDGWIDVANTGGQSNCHVHAHRGQVRALAFQPGNQVLASAGSDHAINIWDLRNSSQVLRLTDGIEGTVVGLKFNREGRGLLAITETGEILDWDIDRRAFIRPPIRLSGKVVAYSLNNSATVIAVAVEKDQITPYIGQVMDGKAPDPRIGMVRSIKLNILDLSNGHEVAPSIPGGSRTLAISPPLLISLSPDERLLAVEGLAGRDHQISIFELESSEEIKSLPISGDYLSMAFSPTHDSDHTFLATGFLHRPMQITRVGGIKQFPRVARDQKGCGVIGESNPLRSESWQGVVAILDLEPSNIDSNIASAASEILRSSLSNTPGVTLVERARLNYVLKEQDFQNNSGRTTRDNAVRIGQILNANTLVVGSIRKLSVGNTFVNVQLIDVESGRDIGSRQLSCKNYPDDEVPAAITKLVSLLGAAEAKNSEGQQTLSPPKVVFISPKQRVQVNANVVSVKVEISSVSGLRSAELVVNGGFDRSQVIPLIDSNKESAKILIDRDVQLPAHFNVITIRATGLNGVVAEDSRTIMTTNSEPVPTAKRGERWAIVIGISKTADSRIEQLQFAHQDALDFANLLESPAMGYKHDHILPLVNEEATTTALTQSFRAFMKKPSVNDSVLIFISGHGAVDPDRQNNAYFITYDSKLDNIAGTALPMRELETSLKENLLAQRVIILVDTCRSGALRRELDGKTFPLPPAEVRAKAIVPGPAEATNHTLDEIVPRAKPGTAVFSSALSGEDSLEGSQWGGDHQPNKGHGVFAWTVLCGLQGYADRNSDGIVTLQELVDFVTPAVATETRGTQHPTMLSGNYDPNYPLSAVDNVSRQGPARGCAALSSSPAK